MTKEKFLHIIENQKHTILKIQAKAYELHAGVNQYYGHGLPYSFHLNMVARITIAHLADVCQEETHVLPAIFAAYFHDSIEDARQTYNDVKKTAQEYMDEEQALMAAEMVYALTNDKGRTRSERAGHTYYQGIRQTPYAPLLKIADRLANLTYSFSHHDEANLHMRQVYRQEWPHFLDQITVPNGEISSRIPHAIIEEAEKLLNKQSGEDAASTGSNFQIIPSKQ